MIAQEGSEIVGAVLASRIKHVYVAVIQHSGGVADEFTHVPQCATLVANPQARKDLGKSLAQEDGHVVVTDGSSGVR